MNRVEREKLLQNYLAGHMSGQEEEEFFIKVALDRELRGELQAHRAIDSAIGKEVSGQPGRHSAVRHKTMAILAATPAPVPAPVAWTGWRGSTWLGIGGLAAVLVVVAFFTLSRREAPEPRLQMHATPDLPAAALAISVSALLQPDPSDGGAAVVGARRLPPVGFTRGDGRAFKQKSTSPRSVADAETRPLGLSPGHQAEPSISSRERHDDSVPVRVRVRIGGSAEKNNGGEQ